jgi:hypothetical protein
VKPLAGIPGTGLVWWEAVLVGSHVAQLQRRDVQNYDKP